MTKNITVTLLEKIVPNVKIDFNEVFKYPDPDFHNKDFIDEHFVKSFLSRNKYDALNDQLKNLFLSKDKRDTLLEYFMKTQKIYWTFKRFARKIYIKNHIKESPHTVDLTLNSLDSHPQHLKVKIIQQDIIYTFFINDIIKIINSSLTYAPDMFSEPTQPKNPYINLPFTTGNLLTIYNFVANSNKVMPKLLHAFFLSEFNIPKFHIEYECLIREEVLKKYYDDASDRKLYSDIIVMLRYHKRACRGLRIHPEFDKDKVIKIFKPMLNHHLVCQYSYQPTKRLFSKRIIKQYLEKFVEDNPDFGKMTSYNRFRRSITTRNTAISDDNPFYFPQLTYPISSNLLDTDLEDGENVYELLEQISTNERIRSRRRFRIRPQQPPPPPPQPSINDEDQNEPSDIEETILDTVGIEEDENIEEDDENIDEDANQDEDEDVDDTNEQTDTFSSGPNNLQIIGTGISSLDPSSNSVYIDNSTNTITSRYVSGSHPSRGARIEYTTHTVTRYPGTSSTLSRSTYSNSTTIPPGFTTDPPGLASSYRAIDNIISNIYNPPVTVSTTSNYFPTNYTSTQITSNDTTSNSNINIYETHNSPFDASMDIIDDSEIDTPTSTTSNTDPFAQSHPEGFNPVHDNDHENP
tara:strand:- start:2718 stop:4619 length:1902 start_codon:yes stop_codon:yes gene_type:complete